MIEDDMLPKYLKPVHVEMTGFLLKQNIECYKMFC
jgi:hypothetical protein